MIIKYQIEVIMKIPRMVQVMMVIFHSVVHQYHPMLYSTNWKHLIWHQVKLKMIWQVTHYWQCEFFVRLPFFSSASSESESDHSPYRLASNKHLTNSRHGLNHKTKPKRIRTIFTPEQLERLESEFDKQQYMVGNERFYLATTLDLTEAQVKVKNLYSINRFYFLIIIRIGLVSKSSYQMASTGIRRSSTTFNISYWWYYSNTSNNKWWTP